MKYLGHKSDDGREQSLIDHLNGTAILCAQFAEAFDSKNLGYIVGQYHDIGKYSLAFQKRIQEDGPKVDHSTAGAKELRDYFAPGSFCIAGHHSGLMNKGTKIDVDNKSLCARFNKALEGSLAYDYYKQEVMSLPERTPSFKLKVGDNHFYTGMFFTRMMFSCLVDADYLDTESFMQNTGGRKNSFDSIAVLAERLEKYTAEFKPAKNKINEKRCIILDECKEKAADEPGLFTLTVPTGGGKTISSLAFALKHAMKYGKKRVIYVIPYTSIIGQTAKVFGDILGSENVVQHHMNIDYDDNEDNAVYIQKHKLATENWDAPIIVTTNVQFFESLYASKTSRCRKLHNIADSVVIFDEAQMLPVDYLLPCVKAIEELVVNYKVTAVLCTATQPSLNKFFTVSINEICSDVQGLYDFFRRVRYENLNVIQLEELAAKLNEHEQVLCIVNSKKDAQQIFDKLKGRKYHLSTFMCSEHRSKVLEEICQCLSDAKPCQVVATSLVEAGVDVDFPVVYRELAGIDNIIQAGGRCNREGKRALADSKVYIFELDKEYKRVPTFIKRPREVSRMILSEFDDIAGQDAIKSYFDRLHYFEGEGLDRKKILERTNKTYSFADIGKDFILIEENGKSLFINRNEKSEQFLQELRLGIRNRSLLRRASQYMVSVYPNQYEKLWGLGQVEKLDDEISVLLDMQAYDEDKGLIVNMDDGVSVFL